MEIKGHEISDDIILNNLNRIQSQIFSLLPYREEGKDWVKPLETLVIEVCGFSNLIPDKEDLLNLACKLEGMRKMSEEIEFVLFRRIIFDCCSLVTKIKNSI